MRGLSERENVLRAMARSGRPEWVPVANDAICTIVSSETRERPPFGQSGKDWFGCSWVWDEMCMGFAPDLHQPFLVEDIADWRGLVSFPDLDSIDWEAAAARDMEGVDRDAKAVRILMESGPLERSHHILGFEGAFMAMYDAPEEYKALVDAIADYKVSLAHRLIDAYRPDDVFFQDDLGHSKGPMISLGTYREFIKPAHMRISEAIRSHGVTHTHHSCGCMEMFIDDLIDAGVQILNPLQPCNDWKMVAERYSDRLSFEVGADFCLAREGSTEEEIRAEVRGIIDVFGPGGNLLVTAFPSNAACLGKMDIVLDEARAYGRRDAEGGAPYG